MSCRTVWKCPVGQVIFVEIEAVERSYYAAFFHQRTTGNNLVTSDLI